MKHLIFFVFMCFANMFLAQNGFTTYTTNVGSIGLKQQSAFLVDDLNNKWIGYNSPFSTVRTSLMKYENATGIWSEYSYTTTPALTTKNVTALAKDNVGNIWIGSDSGLYKFDGIIFTKYTTSHGLPANYIRCIEFIDNQLYVGTYSGLSRFDGSSFTNYNTSNGLLANDTINCIKAETPNNLWLGSKNLLIEFSISNNGISTYTNHPTINNVGLVKCIYIDSQNVKWLGTTSFGLLKFKRPVFEDVITTFDLLPDIIPLFVSDICTGPHNGLLIKYIHKKAGTQTYYGLMELAPNNKTYNYIKSTNTFTVLGDFLENFNGKIYFNCVTTSANNNVNAFYEFDTLNYIEPIEMPSYYNYKYLDINQIKASVMNNNNMHKNYTNTNFPQYEVPKNSNKHTSNFSAMWIGALDQNNLLHLSHQDDNSPTKFMPGPLDTINGETDTLSIVTFNKIWKINKTDIDSFINNYIIGNIFNGSYTVPYNIVSWPAHGNGNFSKNLAPFIDVNLDGIYNPLDGDYPKIKGDQTLYFIYNDNFNRTSNDEGLGLEVHVTAYAYKKPITINSGNELSYTTFYNYKIINRSSNSYHDTYLGLFTEMDLGCGRNDLFGCDVTDNFGFIYNADTVDNNCNNYNGYGNYPPAQGIAILKGPSASTNDGIDNNNNGIIDEPCEDCKLNKFPFFYGKTVAVDAPNSWYPGTNINRYNRLKGEYNDGGKMYCPGDTNIRINWYYPGNPVTNTSSYPNNLCPSLLDGGTGGDSGIGDKRMLLSSGPFNLNANDTTEIEYAFVTSFDSSSITNSNLNSFSKLKSDIQKIRTFYDSITNNQNCSLATQKKEINKNKNDYFQVYPNPTNGLLTIDYSLFDSAKSDKFNVIISNELGQNVYHTILTQTNTQINLSSLRSGIYFYCITQKGITVKQDKLVIIK